MRKVIPIFCIASIVCTPFTVYSQNNNIEQVDEETQLKEEIQIDDTGAGESSGSGRVKELTLEDIMQLGIKNNIDLNLQLESLQKTVSDQSLLQLQEAEIKEGFKLMLTSTYLNLLFLQEQIEYKKKSLSWTIHEVNKQQILFKLGKISSEKLNKINTSKENEERQLEEMERNYGYALSDFCFNIGIHYDEEVDLRPIEFEVNNFERPADINSLIKNSFTMQRAKIENNGLGSNEVLDTEKTYTSTSNKIQRQIEQLYREAEKSFLSYQESIRQLEVKKKELEDLRIRYNLGKIATYDYEKAQLGLEAAELNAYQLKIQNYKIQQSIESLHKGYL